MTVPVAAPGRSSDVRSTARVTTAFHELDVAPMARLPDGQQPCAGGTRQEKSMYARAPPVARRPGSGGRPPAFGHRGQVIQRDRGEADEGQSETAQGGPGAELGLGIERDEQRRHVGEAHENA